MTREFVQLKINELVDNGLSGQALLTALQNWIDSLSITSAEKKKVKEDLNSYEGLEWMS